MGRNGPAEGAAKTAKELKIRSPLGARESGSYIISFRAVRWRGFRYGGRGAETLSGSPRVSIDVFHLPVARGIWVPGACYAR